MVANGRVRRQSNRKVGQGRDRSDTFLIKKDYPLVLMEITNHNVTKMFAVAYDQTTMNTPVLV